MHIILLSPFFLLNHYIVLFLKFHVKIQSLVDVHCCVDHRILTYEYFLTIIFVIVIERHYIEFNSSYLWDFEESPQDSVELSNLITREYLFPPDSFVQSRNFTGNPPDQILDLFGSKVKNIVILYLILIG